MSLLAPWFLWGALAIAAPVIFHLIRKSARDRMPFSSLMFLRATPPRVTRKPRLENWLLLLLRCLCLLLLALAFSRPFFAKKVPDASVNAEEKQIVLLVDTSASMRREGVWEKAISIADKYIKKTTPADQLSIVTFDRQPHALFSFTEWTGWTASERPALAKQRLQATSPGWLGTQLGLALTTAAEKFMEDSAATKGARSREIVVVSDLQEGAKLDGLQGHDWPAGVKVIVERVDPSAKSNAGIGVANDGSAVKDASREVRVRVTNARDSNLEKFRLSWEVPGKSINPTNGLDIYLPAGQTRAFSLPRPEEITHFGQITLAGDEVNFDNKSYYAEAETLHLKVAWLDAGPANDPEKLRYYIDRVFLGTERQEIKIVSPGPNAPISPELLKDVNLAIIPGTLAADKASIVKEWLASGKSALFIANDAQSASTLSAITGLEGISATESSGGFALLNEIDFSHPLFGAFSDPRFSDFSHIHFWKHRKLEFPSGASIKSLARFDDGSPALSQIAVGKGTLLVLASGWNPGDSQLAVSSKFPPFMQTMLDWSGSVVSVQYQFSTGDRIPSPSTEKVEWLKPDGKTESTGIGKSFEATDVPGIYTATFEGKSRKYAVNIPLDESKTTSLSPDQLAGLGVPMKFTAEVAATTITQDPQTLQNSETGKTTENLALGNYRGAGSNYCGSIPEWMAYPKAENNGDLSMIDERLERLLVRLDSQLAHARVRRKWAACGAAVTLSELALFGVRVATGWKSQAMWFGILSAGAIIAWVIWIQERNRKPEFSELVTILSGQDKETGNLLATALEQKPNPETGYLTFLQSRVIDQVIEHPDKDLWFASVRKSADRARNLQIASIFCLITVLFLSAQPPSARLHKVVAWFGPEISVTPGDAEVERGNGVVVTARFGQEAPAEADMILLSSDGAEKRVPLARHLEDPVFGTSIPEISEDAIYRIEYGNKKTRDFKLKVFDYPSMTRADASMNYPSYTGLTNRTIKDTVRISAVEGTKITYNLELNKTVVRANLKSKEQTLALSVKTNALAVLDQYALTNSGRYILELVDADGRTNKSSTEFVFQALPNKPPEIKLSFPTGDQRVSKLEEFNLQSETMDDFGVLKYGIGFGPASEEPKYIELGGDVPGKEKRQFTHQISFEKLGLDVDQVVAYFAWAEDYGPDGKIRRTYTDMFFAEVRPFDEIYRKDDSGMSASQQQEQQQGNQAGNQNPRVKLAELQKQIVIATWKLQREKGGPAKLSTK